MKPLNHVAIILDGNGRWAKQKSKPRTFGHKKGFEKIFDTVIFAKEQGIKYITLFCFSTENWNRPKLEVGFLMDYCATIFNEKNKKKYKDNNIKFIWIGRRSTVPEKVKDALENLEKFTFDNDGIQLNIAFDYGSYEELEKVFQKLFKDLEENKLKVNDINFDLIYKNLYTKTVPPVDLLIRTGGEQRLSNFLLLQSAYAELYFTKTYWPDFQQKDFLEAIESYKNRDRRFGRIED
ncbi:polyprenyl diphosphate synthase [Spiroplasma helicoides]|uniref:polyprenyl diphosphate synthase n=1 Tax=Spiroplasma helicoides TaxID=216938 RepID=UPI000B1586E7|nr:polyprenyl diphosphate synthase [Spiroplasma helicoides]